MTARELMTPSPEVVTPSDLVERAAQIMRDRDIGFVPVVNDRQAMRLEGVITDRDVAIRHVAAAHPQECKVRSHMTRDRIETVGPDADLQQVMRAMKRARVRRIPVVEGDGRILGVIAQADIAVKESTERADEVTDTIEKISEPAEPRR